MMKTEEESRGRKQQKNTRKEDMRRR